MLRQEYACFLHPRSKGQSLDEKCSECGLPFSFPLSNAPVEIAGRTIRRGISRGFYGAVYEAEHRTIRNRTSAIKVIPFAIYAPVESGGYGKDFSAELQLHQELSAIDLVARLLDAGEFELSFNNVRIPCHWLEMEYVRGPTLRDLIEAGPENPRIIAQVASDLFDLVEQLQQRGKFHNDLHSENVKIVPLDRGLWRSSAIAKNVQTKVLDLGSVADASKSAPARWGDIHQVASHILSLTEAYERAIPSVEPGDQRIVSRLRQAAQHWCAADCDSRRARPHDLKASIAAACSYGAEWWMESHRLDAIGAHINAVTMPSHRAHALFCGPAGWRDVMLESGTTLLTGMRGCGKTMLLRSIHWQARVFQYDGETEEEVRERVNTDRFLGLFVSCATLLRGPRPTHIPELVMHRLFLAFALEAVHFIETCDLRKIGSFDGHGSARLSDLAARIAPWYIAPQEPADLYALEASILSALNNVPSESGGIAELNPREAFEDLTAVLRSWGDVVGSKRLLFLLDDVSVRYMSRENVETILKQLCFQSGMFSFKLSTETQTLALHAPGEKLAQVGRDYQVFDLGEEVFAILRDRKQSCEFFKDILMKRAVSTTNLSAAQRGMPDILLGRLSLTDIARGIRGEFGKGKKGEKFLYWSLDGLVALCVGDLGDIITLYERMVQHVAPERPSVAPNVQHKELIDFAEARLRALAVRDPWLYSHAVAFAQASNRELLGSTPQRLRQYAEVDVTIGIEAANELFPLVMKLVDEGVFVATGATSRMKSRDVLQFKLAFRKILGLTHRIPLSMRDRFELQNARLSSWLKSPSSAVLESSRAADETEPDAEQEPEPSAVELQAAEQQLSLAFDGESMTRGDARKPDEAPSIARVLPTPRLLHDVTSRRIPPSRWGAALANCTVVAAIGFEDRSIGAWKNLLVRTVPRRAVLLRYPDPGLMNAANERILTSMLRESTVDTVIVDTGSLPSDDLALCVAADVTGLLVIDVTSMTKAIIFDLVRKGLVERHRLALLHTCADQYFPRESELSDIAEQLTISLDKVRSPKGLKETFDELDRRVTGTKGPYECNQIGETHADPSQPVFLAALISLKHEPIRAILEQGAVERSAMIYPVHSAGRRARRSVVAEQLAHFLGQMYHGDAIPAKSLDHVAVYRELKALHQRWSLSSSYNFEVALAGTKMHTVGAAMFAATAVPSSVYYAKTKGFDVSAFTQGTGETQAHVLERTE
ncbi:MAG: hypothetical protein AB1714_19485 [Acidobacteriota bacterium]